MIELGHGEEIPSSQDLRTVITNATQEAQRFEGLYIGTQHLLLGLLHDGSPVQPILKEHRLRLDSVRGAIGFVTNPSTSQETTEQLELSPAAKEALRAATEEAKKQGRIEADSRDLLQALLRSTGIIMGIFNMLAVDPKRIQAAISS